MTKPLHAGNAARNGNLAGLLAGRGFTASEHWLTAASGFSKAFGADNHSMNEVLSQLGTAFSIISPGIWLKYYPACGGNHSPIEAALKLRQQYSLNPDDIVEVDCAVAPFLPQMLIHHHPKTGLEGKFSLEFGVSVALIDGEALLSQFTDERVNAPDIQAFIPKVKYHILPELGNITDLNIPVTISITLRNGTKVSITENNPTGKPTNPMSPEQLRKKFETCTRILSPEERAEVVKLVSNMEKLDGIDSLMNLLVGRRQQ
jgi:2-methylcitrate dehydratase PrpD